MTTNVFRNWCSFLMLGENILFRREREYLPTNQIELRFICDVLSFLCTCTYAVKPRVVNISRDAVRVSLDISTPKILLYHPGGEKFELKNLSVAVVEGEETREILAEKTREFRDTWHVTVELPTRAERTLEDLEVVACYKDGRKESSGPLNCPLPVYGEGRLLTSVGSVKLSVFCFVVVVVVCCCYNLCVCDYGRGADK